MATTNYSNIGGKAFFEEWLASWRQRYLATRYFSSSFSHGNSSHCKLTRCSGENIRCVPALTPAGYFPGLPYKLIRMNTAECIFEVDPEIVVVIGRLCVIDHDKIILSRLGPTNFRGCSCLGANPKKYAITKTDTTRVRRGSRANFLTHLHRLIRVPK